MSILAEIRQEHDDVEDTLRSVQGKLGDSDVVYDDELCELVSLAVHLECARYHLKQAQDLLRYSLVNIWEVI
jgi:hypothetical protein